MTAGRGKKHARTRPAVQAGFTLVELLVAVSIATVVVLAAYAALTGGLRVYERATSVSQQAQVVRALVERMTRELQATYFNPQAPDAKFVGEEPEGTMGATGSTTGPASTSASRPGTSSLSSRAPGTGTMGGSTMGNRTPGASTGGTTSTGAGTAGTTSANASTAAARLTFVAAAGLSPLTEVEYFIEEPDPQTGTPGGLYRQERFLLDRQQAAGGSVVETDSGEEAAAVLVAPEVVGFEVAYYDAQALTSGGLGLQGSLTAEDAWETSWDAAAKGYLPQAVRITLNLGSWSQPAASSAEAASAGVTTTERVTFVVALPLAEAQASQAAGSSTQSGSGGQAGSGG